MPNGGGRREHSAARHVSNQLDAYTDSSYMKRKTSPKDARCPHCGGWYTQRGVKEHLRHHCRPCPTSRKRVFNNATCKHCGLTYHSGNSLRVHVATQHKHEYARSPNSVRHHRAPHSKKKRNHQTSGARARHRSQSAAIATARVQPEGPAHGKARRTHCTRDRGAHAQNLGEYFASGTAGRERGRAQEVSCKAGYIVMRQETSRAGTYASPPGCVAWAVGP